MSIRLRSSRAAAVTSVAAALVACGGGDGTAETSRAPERAGEVWEVDRVDERAAAEGALLAYVSGLHVVILDDDDAFAGMTRLRLTDRDGGGRRLTLANGGGAELVPAGEGLELRFPDGQRVPMRRQVPRPSR
jgi:hypothetical protein